MAKKSLSGGMVYSTDPNFKPFEEHSEIHTLAPEKQALIIRIDRSGRNGKEVTLVDRFVGNEADLDALAKKMKQFCGVGGSVKDGQIIIQGDQRDKLAQFCTKHAYGFKKGN